MTNIHQRLQQDHERLDRLCVELTALVAGGSSQRTPAASEAIADFESGLLAHFEGEEKYLFPILQEEFPEEVLALREEHEVIRRQVAALVEEDDAARDPAQLKALSDRLIASLKRHSRREDGMLYSLVAQSSSNETYQRLIEYLEATYQRLRA